jgi:hypothetical protein
MEKLWFGSPGSRVKSRIGAMARYKILLLRDDGSEVAELAVDALWRSDAVAFAERATEDAAEKCGYELWCGHRKIARRLSAQH